MPTQLPLPFAVSPALGRADFIVSSLNAPAVAFIDSFPNWSSPVGALYGEPASGKSHLANIWAAKAGAAIVDALALDQAFVGGLAPGAAVAVEDVRDGIDEAALFELFEEHGPVLLTALTPPTAWTARLPDLLSRFGTVLAYPLFPPDEATLARLTRKLFTDRQLAVPDSVVMRILRSIERSPAAVRDFVARADARALAEKRPITVPLVAEMLGAGPLS